VTGGTARDFDKPGTPEWLTENRFDAVSSDPKLIA
jgi:hypothetical protein